MSGREFLKCIKSESAALAAIPIVVMTAVPDVQIEGAAAMLRKPMDFDDIVGRLRQLLNLSPSFDSFQDGRVAEK
jgi:response regulator RpfG family c-di-GMP phosphodiesterase